MDTRTLSDALALAEQEAPGGQGGSLHDTAAALRRHCAPLRVVVVDAHDMRDETPALSSARHRIYFGASDGHCWSVTQDPARAAGLFVSERGPG
jgi:hypothetical protein